MNKNIDYRKYVFSFLITAIIFATAIYLSNYFGEKKLNEIRNIQDNISIDILSSETQFSLLAESSCKNIGTGFLSTELSNLEKKLSYTENERGASDPEVQTLKKSYFLLEIKDYLLMNKISEKCKTTPLSIIYFYSNKDKCPDCEREGFVLTKLRETYPDLRVYSFDYDVDLSAVKTLISIKKLRDEMPAMVIGENILYGFQSLEDLEKAMPELAKLKAENDLRNASTTNEA